MSDMSESERNSYLKLLGVQRDYILDLHELIKVLATPIVTIEDGKLTDYAMPGQMIRRGKDET